MKIPIRIRAYHRAVKRKEKWAMDIAKHPKGSFAWMLAFYFRTVDIAKELARRDAAILNAPKSNDWKGGFIVVPFKRGGSGHD